MTHPGAQYLAEQLQADYDKVKEWPENSETGFMDLISLRNLVPDAIALLAAEKARADAAEAERDSLRLKASDLTMANSVLSEVVTGNLPERIWAERDGETNEKRWFSIKGMGVAYIRAEAAEAAESTVSTLTAERDALIRDRDDLRAKLATADALVTCCCGSPVDSHGMGDGHSPVDMYHYAYHQLEERLATAERERDEAREALRPFADAAESYDPPEGDDSHMAWAHDFPIGSLRRARATLSRLGKNEGGGE